MKIDNRIRLLRKERRLSQEMLADMVDVTRQTIISLESGKYTASLALAYQLARVFDCTIEELFIFIDEDDV